MSTANYITAREALAKIDAMEARLIALVTEQADAGAMKYPTAAAGWEAVKRRTLTVIRDEYELTRLKINALAMSGIKPENA